MTVPPLSDRHPDRIIRLPAMLLDDTALETVQLRGLVNGIYCDTKKSTLLRTWDVQDIPWCGDTYQNDHGEQDANTVKRLYSMTLTEAQANKWPRVEGQCQRYAYFVVSVSCAAARFYAVTHKEAHDILARVERDKFGSNVLRAKARTKPCLAVNNTAV